MAAEQKGSDGVPAASDQAYSASGNKKLDVYVSWEDLRFEVPDPNDKSKTKTILNSLHGHVLPGQLVAVIGPSGSGKSSFLNCVAGRNTRGVTGKLLFNGVPRPSNFARFTGYVVQDDTYFESLTVKESLVFAANLKLPMTMSKELKAQRVRDVIEELDLGRCQNTRIGTIGKGISGGERRRLGVGLEIINEPSLLLLDEPTTGLDSASALMLGRILQRLVAEKNITILCTIHQPRYALATMFDKIYFLAKGNEIYFGPSVPDCLPFFEDAGYKCPPFTNPADFLLDLVNTAIEQDIDASSSDFGADAAAEAESLVPKSQGKADEMEMAPTTAEEPPKEAAGGAEAPGADGGGTALGVTGQHAAGQSSQVSGSFINEMLDYVGDNDSEHEIDKDLAKKMADEAGTAQDDEAKGKETGAPGDEGAGASAEPVKPPPFLNRDQVITHLVGEYQNSAHRANALKFTMPASSNGDIVFKTIASEFYITPWYNQFRVVMKRSFLHKFREPIALQTQIFNATVIPLIFGSMYWQIDLSQQGSLDRLSAISILVIMLAFFAFDILMLFPLEREIFNRENASGMYRPSMFYFGRTTAEMPQHIILMAVMGTLTYWMYGLQADAGKYFNWLILFELTGLCGASLLLLFSAMAKNLEQSNLLATFFLLLFMLFDGNWISIDKVPVYWRWVQYVSLFAFGAQGCMVNEYTGLEFKCTAWEVTNGECFYTDGKDVLAVRGIEDVSVSECMWALALLIIGFRALAFVCVLFLYRVKPASQIWHELIGKSE